MPYIDSAAWETTRRRYELMWQGEILDRVCISVKVPDPAHISPPPQNPKDLYRWYTDGEWVLRRNLEAMEHTYYGGDAFPSIFPYIGTGGHAKYIADPDSIQYTPDTVWIHPCLPDLAPERFAFDPDTNPVLRGELALMDYLAKEAKGRYFVSPPDNCGSYDALSQLRGNSRLLMDFYDRPEEVLEAGRHMTDIFLRSNERIFSVLKDAADGGSVQSWMNVFHPGRHMQLQCDMSVMISPDLFRDYIVEELTDSANSLDAAIYHLDGQEQVRHLDYILSIPNIRMIQWVSVEGQPPITTCLHHLRRIQESGRGLMLNIKKHELKEVLEGISSKGVTINILDASTKEEADDLVALAARMTHA